MWEENLGGLKKILLYSVVMFQCKKNFHAGNPAWPFSSSTEMCKNGKKKSINECGQKRYNLKRYPVVALNF